MSNSLRTENDIQNIVATIIELHGPDGIDRDALVRGVRKSMNIFYGHRREQEERIAALENKIERIRSLLDELDQNKEGK